MSKKSKKLKKDIAKAKAQKEKAVKVKEKGKSEKPKSENCLTYGIGEASVLEVNKLGVHRATFSAFRRCTRGMQVGDNFRVEYLLIDAFYIPYLRGYPKGVRIGKNRNINEVINLKYSRQKPIVRGDKKSFSIACASIIAKVYRDNLMTKLGTKDKYIVYDWENNKGYGTEKHRTAIKKHGTTKHHRLMFIEKHL